MLRFASALLACASAASAAMMMDTVNYRFPTKGLHGIAFTENNVSVAIAVRTSEGSEITVRGSVTQVSEGTANNRYGSVEIFRLDAQYNAVAQTSIAASCPRDDSAPRCSLEVLVPPELDVTVWLNYGVENRAKLDGMRGRADVKLYTGDVELLNHRGPADVYGMDVVCTVADQRPADTLRLEAYNKLTLYYPDSIRAEVSVPACSSPAVEGLKTSSGMSTCITDYTLNPQAPGPARYINLVNGGTVRPLSAYGKE